MGYYSQPASQAGFISFFGSLAKGNGNTLIIPAGQINIGGNGKGLIIQSQNDWDPLLASNRDDSFTAFVLGDDYCVYACIDTPPIAIIKTSKNTTFPNGYNELNSRKIGGFHYGRVRGVNANSAPVNVSEEVYGIDWESNVAEGIVPNSVWDLRNRPKCDPGGMVKNGSVWIDIYQTSAAGQITLNNGKLEEGLGQSVFGDTPITGTEGLHCYNFSELAARSGKRLPTYEEWCIAAEGSPQGNNGDNVNAWTATSNTDRTATGSVVNAISSRNVVDCVGNVWEWTGSQTARSDSASGFSWRNVMAGEEVGQLYMLSPYQLINIIAGGHWAHGVCAGSRCASLYNYPWDVHVHIGARFACDSL